MLNRSIGQSNNQSTTISYIYKNDSSSTIARSFQQIQKSDLPTLTPSTRTPQRNNNNNTIQNNSTPTMISSNGQVKKLCQCSYHQGTMDPDRKLQIKTQAKVLKEQDKLKYDDYIREVRRELKGETTADGKSMVCEKALAELMNYGFGFCFFLLIEIANTCVNFCRVHQKKPLSFSPSTTSTATTATFL